MSTLAMLVTPRHTFKALPAMGFLIVQCFSCKMYQVRDYFTRCTELKKGNPREKGSAFYV